MNTWQFILQHADDDVSMLALKKKQYPDVDIAFALRQIEGRQCARRKLPQIHAISDWHYPQRLSLEQCSSQTTAIYKQSILRQTLCGSASMADLTGGMGIDTFYLSELFGTTHYIDLNEELCNLARHNFAATKKNITVHHCDAADFLRQAEHLDCVMLDPSRRDKAGRKVYLLDDCEPKTSALYPLLQEKCDILLLKLSPMLDLTAALMQLPHATQVHIVAVGNEVKETLIICRFNRKETTSEPVFQAVNLNTDDPDFAFTRQEELTAQCRYAAAIGRYVYEPNAAIMKAGAYRLISQRFDLEKLAPDSHLYTSERLVPDFPGRTFLVNGIAQPKNMQGTRFSIISRNHPLSADQIRNKYKIAEDDTHFLIATRLSTRPIFIECGKV